MYKKMSKGRAILFIITCWITSFTIMWQMPEMVIVNDLYEAFPNQAGVVTAMLSWPSLVTALSSLLAGSLLQKITTKTELMIGGITLLFMISAPAPNNIYWVFICSMIAAFGAGFSNTAGMSVISEVFVDEDKRSKHMGFYNAAMALIGAVISYIAGVLAVNGWQTAFSVNWFAIPMLIMTFLFIPNIRPEDRPQEETAPEGSPDTASTTKQGFGARFWIFFISTFLFFMAYVPISSYISVYISENNLGNTAFAGTCTSISTIGSCVCCLIFGFVYAKIKRKISIIVFIVDLVLFTWAMTAPSTASAIIASIGAGASYGTIFSLCYAYGAEIVPMSKIGMAMGIMTFDYAVGITVGVYLVQGIMSVTGSLTRTIIMSVVLCAISLIIEIAANIGDAKNSKKAVE